jgi:hypothetical protein
MPDHIFPNRHCRMHRRSGAVFGRDWRTAANACATSGGTSATKPIPCDVVAGLATAPSPDMVLRNLDNATRSGLPIAPLSSANPVRTGKRRQRAERIVGAVWSAPHSLSVSNPDINAGFNE